MGTSTKSKRKEDRIPSEHLVNLGNGIGTTRNISASGMYFEIDASCVPGRQIDFTVEFDSPGGSLLLKCSGEVIRIEPHDGKIGVAVKILKSVMVAASNAESRA